MQFGQQVGRLGDVEGTRRDEQDVVGFYGSVLRRHGGAFDQGQQVALDAFAGHVGAAGFRAGGDLVDFVEEDDAVLLDGVERGLGDGFVVEQLVGFFADQHVIALGDGQALFHGASREALAEERAEVDAHRAALPRWHARHVEALKRI